jgi:hypothetical protein
VVQSVRTTAHEAMWITERKRKMATVKVTAMAISVVV